MNMFRFKDGRLDQIGYSWCKDGFCALQLNECGSCDPAGSGCPQLLGPGCSDPYSSSLNGSQGGLAPKWQCNAATGQCSSTRPPAFPAYAQTIGRRIQVLQVDLSPQQNPGGMYYTDSQYLHPQDYEAGNNLNNGSYKRMLVGSLSGKRLLPHPERHRRSWASPRSMRGKTTVIQRHHQGGATLPNDGRLLIASDVIDNGDGTFRYEYAIYNYQSDDGVNGFTIPVPAGVDISNVEFSFPTFITLAIPYSNDNWVVSQDSNSITWSTDEFSQDEDANAIRWASMYNFSFTANAEPDYGRFRPRHLQAPTPQKSSVALYVPGGSCQPVRPQRRRHRERCRCRHLLHAMGPGLWQLL